MRPTDLAVRRAEIVRTLNAAFEQLGRLVACCEARQWTEPGKDLVKLGQRLAALTNRINDEVIAEALRGRRPLCRRELRAARPTRRRVAVGVPVSGRRRNAA